MAPARLAQHLLEMENRLADHSLHDILRDLAGAPYLSHCGDE
jgi:hypothetical protein